MQVKDLAGVESMEVFNPRFLSGFAESLGLSVAIAGEGGEILWVSDSIDAEFPGAFRLGRPILEALDEATLPDPFAFSYAVGPFSEELLNQVLRGGTLRRRILPSGAVKVYRHFRFSFEEIEGIRVAHCLVDITPEKQLFQTYRNNLHQLSSMKEIIDLLYEWRSTGEVINLILVAVTAREGFGFNRAFFLEVAAGRLRGRIGIGPASAEEAHRIWSRLAASTPTLRETLHLLSKAGGPPDPATQAMALRIDLPLGLNGSPAERGGIIQACREGRPALVARSQEWPAATLPAEEELFRILGSDAFAVVPLTIQGRLAGVLLADNFITRKPISQEDLDLLKTFSGYAAVAFERSSLHDELTRNLEKLREANHELQSNQQKLLHAEKLSTLGELAAHVSHEIRNPLVAIGGLARSILRDCNGADDSREVLGIIVSEVQRLERFLKETLDFAKPSLEPFKTIDFAELIRDVVQTFREGILRGRIELDLLLPDQPVVSCIDPDLFRGAISNLIRNAQEALEPGGRIRILLRRQADIAEIEVGDTGPGIPEGIRGLVFEPFFTTKKDGTGIGLAITEQNIRNSGGTITIESDPPYQTVFRIKLPIKNNSTEERSRS